MSQWEAGVTTNTHFCLRPETRELRKAWVGRGAYGLRRRNELNINNEVKGAAMEREKQHTINIPERLWNAYGGSPQRMRDTLWRIALDGDGLLQLELAPKEEEPAWEYDGEITARFATRCSVCGQKVKEGERVQYRIPSEGPRQIIHLRHIGEAPEGGVGYPDPGD